MAGVNKCARDQETRPLPGALDLRSPDGAVKRGYVRILLNLLVGEDGHLVRMGGFRRLGWDSPHFCNQDLHDPLLGIENNDCAEPCVPPTNVVIAGPSMVPKPPLPPEMILTVTFTGDHTGATYQMFKDGTSLGPAGPDPVFTVVGSGTYSARVTNACGSAVSPGRVISPLPQDPLPTITDPPNLTVDQFALALFPVTASVGATVKWEFRPNSGAPWVSADNYGGGSNTSTFSANTHIVYAAAQVRALATNAVGTVYSRPGTLTIRKAVPAIGGNTSPQAGTDQPYTMSGITPDWSGANTKVHWDLEQIAEGCPPAAAFSRFASYYVADQNMEQYPPEWLLPDQEANAHSLIRQEIAALLHVDGQPDKHFTIVDDRWNMFSTGTPTTPGFILANSTGDYATDLASMPTIMFSHGWSLDVGYCESSGPLAPPPIPITETGRVVHITFPASGVFDLHGTPTVDYIVNTISGGVSTPVPLPMVTLRIVPVTGFISSPDNYICFTTGASVGVINLFSTFGSDDDFTVTGSGWSPEKNAGSVTYQPFVQVEPEGGAWRTYHVLLTPTGSSKVSSGQAFPIGAAWTFRYRANGASTDSTVRVEVRNCAPTAPATQVRWLRSVNPNITLADIDNPDPAVVLRRDAPTIAGDCTFPEDPPAPAPPTWCYICLPDNAGSAPRAGDGMTIVPTGLGLVLAKSVNGGDQLAYNQAVNGWSYTAVSGWRVFRIMNQTAGGITVRIST